MGGGAGVLGGGGFGVGGGGYSGVCAYPTISDIQYSHLRDDTLYRLIQHIAIIKSISVLKTLYNPNPLSRAINSWLNPCLPIQCHLITLFNHSFPKSRIKKCVACNLPLSFRYRYR